MHPSRGGPFDLPYCAKRILRPRPVGPFKLDVCVCVTGFLANHHAAAEGFPRCSLLVVCKKFTKNPWRTRFGTSFKPSPGTVTVDWEVPKTLVLTRFWTSLKWSPGTVSVDWGVPKTACFTRFRTSFRSSPGTVSVDWCVPKTVFSHVLGPVWNEVQEQYLWIEGSRKGGGASRPCSAECCLVYDVIESLLVPQTIFSDDYRHVTLI